MPRVLVPPSPGIFSATGLLTTDLKRDAATTVMRRADALDPAELDAAFEELERAGADELVSDGLSRNQAEFVRSLDMRYVGQSYELALPAGDELLERFHAHHERVYGFAAPTEPVELVSVRLTSVGRIEKPSPRTLASGAAPEAKDLRPVYFAEADGFVDCPIHRRDALPAGAPLSGPVVVEELDSTTVVHPGYRVHADENAHLIVEREGT
jgi:N-methylhydantoinase A